jgi:hypothetical protein
MGTSFHKTRLNRPPSALSWPSSSALSGDAITALAPVSLTAYRTSSAVSMLLSGFTTAPALAIP